MALHGASVPWLQMIPLQSPVLRILSKQLIASTDSEILQSADFYGNKWTGTDTGLSGSYLWNEKKENKLFMRCTELVWNIIWLVCDDIVCSCVQLPRLFNEVWFILSYNPHGEVSRDIVITVKDAKSDDNGPTSGSRAQIRGKRRCRPAGCFSCSLARAGNYGHDHRLTLEHVYTRHK